MSGWTAAIVSMVLVTNPAAVSWTAAWPERRGSAWRSEAVATVAGLSAVLAGIGLVGGPLLRWLDLSTPTFVLAAAVIMGLTGARFFLGRTEPVVAASDRRTRAVTLGALHLLTPGPVFAAIAASGDGGIVAGLVAVALAGALCVAALVLPRGAAPLHPAVVRMIGAATIVAAIAIGLDAARTV